MSFVLLNKENNLLEIFQEIGNYNENHQGMQLDTLRFHVDNQEYDIKISEIINFLKLRSKVDIMKIDLGERLSEYQEAYIQSNTDSLDILEYAENEFFGGKKEVYEELIEYMNNNGI